MPQLDFFYNDYIVFQLLLIIPLGITMVSRSETLDLQYPFFFVSNFFFVTLYVWILQLSHKINFNSEIYKL